MDLNRRKFIQQSSAGLAMAGIASQGFASSLTPRPDDGSPPGNASERSIIGQYGPWAAKRIERELPSKSFRRPEWKDVGEWSEVARTSVLQRLAVPDIGSTPRVTTIREYDLGDLRVEELEWQLPYGRPTQALVLKPANARGKLPAILAFHDHGGNKFFGTEKITKTASQHPLMKAHQEHYYEGTAWANELALRGYVVLVSDAFTFASRRVHLSDVPERLRQNVPDEDRNDHTRIEAYNKWASNHEHIMAKSLFSAGTTWPGVFLAEDRIALDILASRPDVDASRIGCGGLSGGGLRTVMTGGLDPRIKCAVCVGFMSTWKDFALNKSWTHTWMTYVPLLPNELDFPEIMSIRAPLPTLVQNDEDDALYTLPEMKRADDIMRAVYDKAGASDRYRASFYPGPHKFDRAMQKEAFSWFDQWLR